MGTSTARTLTCDRPASYTGGVLYSHSLALRNPGINTGLMSLKEGLNLRTKDIIHTLKYTCFSFLSTRITMYRKPSVLIMTILNIPVCFTTETCDQ